MNGSKAQTANDVFWLASYAHRTISPLFTELRELEPTAALYITMAFGASAYSRPWHIDVSGHWEREEMIVLQTCLHTTSAVDEAAKKVRSVIDSLRAEVAA